MPLLQCVQGIQGFEMRKYIFILVLLALTGCKTKYITTEVPVVVEHTTHEKSTELRVDTVYHRDSTIVMMLGDTVVERHYNTIYKVRETVKSDTLRDTIPIITEVVRTETKEVEKPLNWWQRLFQSLGLLTAGGAVFWLLYKIKR